MCRFFVCLGSYVAALLLHGTEDHIRCHVTLGMSVVLSDTNCFDKTDLDRNVIHYKRDYVCGPQCRDIYGIALCYFCLDVLPVDDAAVNAVHVLSCP